MSVASDEATGANETLDDLRIAEHNLAQQILALNEEIEYGQAYINHLQQFAQHIGDEAFNQHPERQNLLGATERLAQLLEDVEDLNNEHLRVSQRVERMEEEEDRREGRLRKPKRPPPPIGEPGDKKKRPPRPPPDPGSALAPQFNTPRTVEVAEGGTRSLKRFARFADQP